MLLYVHYVRIWRQKYTLKKVISLNVLENVAIVCLFLTSVYLYAVYVFVVIYVDIVFY